jgi:hypothetical protein
VKNVPESRKGKRPPTQGKTVSKPRNNSLGNKAKFMPLGTVKTTTRTKKNNLIQIVGCKQSCLNPNNIDLQQSLFFSSNFTVNPIFAYDNVNSTQRTLGLYSEPRSALLDTAKIIMESLLREYGTESRYLEETGGDLLTKDETQEIFTSYIRSLGLENHINLAFAENTVSPTAITHDHKGKSTIIIGLPIEYRRKRIQGVLDHEIGTHFLRKFNDSYQIWTGANRKRLELKPYIVTEEGFASINQLIHIVSLAFFIDLT